MKILKTMTATALLLMGTVAMAQGFGNRTMRSATERAKMETERVAKSLELTPEQTIKVQEVNLKYAVKDSIHFAEMQKGEQPSEEARAAMMKTMQANRAAKTADVKAILTDAQKEKYDTYLKERGQRRNRPEGQGGPGVNRPQGGQE